MMIPSKKPAVDVMLAIGKPKPPAMKGGPMGAPDKPGMADEPELPPVDDSAECMKRMESKIDKIMEALQIEHAEDQPDDTPAE